MDYKPLNAAKLTWNGSSPKTEGSLIKNQIANKHFLLCRRSPRINADRRNDGLISP